MMMYGEKPETQGSDSCKKKNKKKTNFKPCSERYTAT